MPSRRAFVVAAALVAVSSGAAAQGSADPAQLVAVMERYAAALRSGNVEALVALYTPNGVFMRENMPAAVGRDALRAAYEEVFAALKVDLAFSIQETEVVGDIAWLRSTSKGKVKVLSSGAETTNSFDELVVFRREQGGWKIRSYMYGSNQPGPQPSK
ncbi:SgcJ/EcaC family oxidoreductase [Reyranella sp.]|uniref:YybH family protein n=1 Tax=Reyranella sp. TaxID=1929291 RepID=UPI001206FCFC|nr:SgcJ/EcaC family oxidoreductase [Reyranella sp.]TAJ85863.1 MAG: SgcJ/EcaC family oxidoreductase [Reyranella sp.]